MPPRKRTLQSPSSVAEPRLSPEQHDAWCDGIELFDGGEYWEAHESWETLWREMGDGPDDDAEIVIRGFIQLAAALHLVGVGRLDGAASNFAKAAAKLALAPPRFLGVDVEALRSGIPEAIAAMPRLQPMRIRPRASSRQNDA